MAGSVFKPQRSLALTTGGSRAADFTVTYAVAIGAGVSKLIIAIHVFVLTGLVAENARLACFVKIVSLNAFNAHVRPGALVAARQTLSAEFTFGQVVAIEAFFALVFVFVGALFAVKGTFSAHVARGSNNKAWGCAIFEAN